LLNYEVYYVAANKMAGAIHKLASDMEIPASKIYNGRTTVAQQKLAYRFYIRIDYGSVPASTARVGAK